MAGKRRDGTGVEKQVSRQAHNLEIAGSNPAPSTETKRTAPPPTKEVIAGWLGVVIGAAACGMRFRTLTGGCGMSSFLWQVVRAAIVDGSSAVIAAAAELVAKYLPFTLDQVTAFLKATLDAFLAKGDEWLDSLATAIVPRSMSAADPHVVGCDKPDCPCELSDHKAIVHALAAA